MKKVLKWIGIVLGALIGLVVIGLIVGSTRANGFMTQEWDYPPNTVAIPTDTESIARGQYMVDHFMLCADCHGPDLGGAEFFSVEDGAGTLWAPNLTSGNGGIGVAYTDADWLRALRHGIRPNGENLIIMPSEFYTLVDINEMAGMIAYLKTLPPVDREIPTRDLALMPKAMLGLGIIPTGDFLVAHKIDHAATPASAPDPGVNVEYGEYLAMVCTACHGPDLAGMPADPDSGSAATPNLTLGGELQAWSEADFITTLQTGVTPSGHELVDRMMPWTRIGSATEGDLRTIWMYLQSLPALPSNQ